MLFGAMGSFVDTAWVALVCWQFAAPGACRKSVMRLDAAGSHVVTAKKQTLEKVLGLQRIG